MPSIGTGWCAHFSAPRVPANGGIPILYTNFDPRDNVRVADTFDKRVPKRLFPVINVALNRTSGKDTARAERKAEPFTITPLHCGSPSLDKPQGEPVGAYVPTRFFAGGGKETGPFDDENGITLGTAMTLSGAAVSPNMGYHSSPFVAFVMTLFNLRLGAWLPNPGGKPSPTEETMTLAGPNDAIGTMLKDSDRPVRRPGCVRLPLRWRPL